MKVVVNYLFWWNLDVTNSNTIVVSQGALTVAVEKAIRCEAPH
jgi:hypothetical protein